MSRGDIEAALDRCKQLQRELQRMLYDLENIPVYSAAKHPVGFHPEDYAYYDKDRPSDGQM